MIIVDKLITAEEREIRHFTFGLISDLTKNYNISQYAQYFLVKIAQNLDQNNITSLNNALMCITDLICTN